MCIRDRYIEGVVSHAGAYRLLASMRVHLYGTIRKLAPACLMDREKGDLLNIAVSDIETVEFFFAHTIGPMFTVILLPCVPLGPVSYTHLCGVYRRGLPRKFLNCQAIEVAFWINFLNAKKTIAANTPSCRRNVCRKVV